MILTTLLMIPFCQLPTAQITETKLFKVDKKKVAQGSISMSPDLSRYSYVTTDHRVVVDGKTYGPYLTNGAVLFSGDSKDFAFMAGLRDKEPQSLIFNGTVKLTDKPVSGIFRAGETGGICWGEVNTILTKDEKDPQKENRKDFTRLVYPGGATEWMEKIEKIFFSDDGSQFALRTSEKIPSSELPPNSQGPSSRDFIVYPDGKKVPRGRVIQVFSAPNSQGFATVLDGTASAGDVSTLNSFEVSFKGRTTVSKGEFYSKPIFSPDGKQFAYRNSYTGHTKDGTNIQMIQYVIGGFSVEDLQVQTGLTFSPDGKKWVMCGLNGKDPYLYVSTMGLLRYDEVPMLNGAPPEPYRIAKFAGGKMVLLFQKTRSKPFLFVEEKGLFELGAFSAYPETLSISPDGTKAVIAAADAKETRAYMVDLISPGPAKEILKPGYDLQNLGKGTFVWKGDRDLTFLILRNSELVRISAKL